MGLTVEEKQELIRLIENGDSIPEHLRVALLADEPAASFKNEAIGLFRTHIASGKMLSCNQRAAQLLGYADAAECKLKHDAPASYADPQQREQLLELLRRTGEVRCYPVKIMRPDGEAVQVRLWSRLDPEAGTIDGAVDIFTSD